jgi:hypothetical protein
MTAFRILTPEDQREHACADTAGLDEREPPRVSQHIIAKGRAQACIPGPRIILYAGQDGLLSNVVALSTTYRLDQRDDVRLAEVECLPGEVVKEYLLLPTADPLGHCSLPTPGHRVGPGAARLIQFNL